MELTFNELKKRDVINVSDGRCLGRINNVNFSFPQGILTGIFIPSRKNRGFFWFLDKSTIFIGVDKIIKIGGDVILVDIRCGDNCLPSTGVGKQPKNPPPHKKPQPPCNPCPPPCPPKCNDSCANNTIDLSGLFDQNGRIDLDDY